MAPEPFAFPSPFYTILPVSSRSRIQFDEGNLLSEVPEQDPIHRFSFVVPGWQKSGTNRRPPTQPSISC